MEDNVTTEVVATPTDSANMYVDNMYSISDMYLLHYVFILLAVAVLTKFMFRKMYVNILGGRKGE